ncbi:hypothetical protein [Methanovulcanius yangii]|uniref:hypothetical protein n=1 Tax=Methanovulcanius yangii TaxID=1789227 RepID=UPI0029C9E9F3|nr:hypothetical protein [Methanovulcanius yangii]
MPVITDKGYGPPHACRGERSRIRADGPWRRKKWRLPPHGTKMESICGNGRERPLIPALLQRTGEEPGREVVG